jgi:tetratricopeptide (TPR) repeat protein
MQSKLIQHLLIQFSLLITFAGCTNPSLPLLRQPLNRANIDSFVEQQAERMDEDNNDLDAVFEMARGQFFMGENEQAEDAIRVAVQGSPLNPEFLELLGKILYARGRYADAIKEWNAALQVDPDRLSIYLNLGLGYEQIREYGKAVVSLDEALQQDENYVEAYFHMTRVQIKRQNYESALEAVENLLILEPSNRDGQLLRLRIFVAQGNYYPASVLASELLAQDPEWVEVLREQLRLFYLQQKMDDALARIKELARMGKLEPEDQLIYALLLSNQGSRATANQVLENLLRSDPTNVEALLGLAQLSLEAGAYGQALELVEKALEIKNQRADLYYLKASLLFQRRDYLRGDIALARALELDDRPMPYQLLNASRKLMRGELQQVEQIIENLKQRDATNIYLLALQADLLVTQGRYDEAEALLRQALVVRETFSLRFSLARVLYLQGKYSRALSYTEDLLKDSPSHWESVYLQAMTLLQLNQTDRALKLSENFLARDESQGLAHRLVADINRYRGQEQEAQEVLVRGLERYPRQFYLIEALSASYLVTRQYKEAKIMLENALKANSPFQSVFLDRLATVYRQLNDQEAYQRTLRQFQQLNDPISIQQSLSVPPLFQLLSTEPMDSLVNTSSVQRNGAKR